MGEKPVCAKVCIIIFGILGMLSGIGNGVLGLLTLLSGAVIGHLSAQQKQQSQNRMDQQIEYQEETSHGHIQINGKPMEEEMETVNTVLVMVAIALIVCGIISLFDGIIAIVGAVKENWKMLTIHAVLLVIYILIGLYPAIARCSVTSLIAMIIPVIRLGIVAYMIKILKQQDAVVPIEENKQPPRNDYA